MALFWNVWSNPQTTIFKVVRYLVMMAGNSSLTWSAHLRTIFQHYNLPSPLALLDGPLWSKNRWKDHTKTAVVAQTEAVWRSKAANNSKLAFLNVSTLGLSGRPHPLVSSILSTQDIDRSRIHIKMLAGDYQCYASLARDRDMDPHCRLCRSLAPHRNAPEEDLIHLLTICQATAVTRARLVTQLLNTVATFFPQNEILDNPNHATLTQFILDCTSLNLPNTIRVSSNHPNLVHLLASCSDLCYAIHKDRLRQLRSCSYIKERKK